MKASLLVLVLLTVLVFCRSAHGQIIKGTVADRSTRIGLSEAEVLNLSTKEKVSTNKLGEFKIAAQPNQVLIFSQPGYGADTLLLTSLKPVMRYLVALPYQLQTVEINSNTFDPITQYADVYREAQSLKLRVNKPLEFYPSRHFSKKGKSARKLKRKLENELIERQVDARFNVLAVTRLIPLKGVELDYFMVLYRPTLKELNKMDGDVFKFYLMNCYKKFKVLPPEQKRFPLMKVETP